MYLPVQDIICKRHLKRSFKYFAPCCYIRVPFTRSKLSCLWWNWFWKNPQNGTLEWVHRSQASSSNNLCRLLLSQWLFGFHGISNCPASIWGVGHGRRTKGDVPEPGGRTQMRVDAKGKAVDFSALQCVAGVILMSLVPGKDTSFMLRSCWTCSVFLKKPDSGLSLFPDLVCLS